MCGSVLEKKLYFKMLGLSFSTYLNWDSYIICLQKLRPSKLELLFVLWNLFLLKLHFVSVNLRNGLAWNTVVIPGLLFPATNWIYWINYRNGYVRLLVLHFLPLFKPLALRRKLASWNLFYRYYFGRYSSEHLPMCFTDSSSPCCGCSALPGMDPY